MATICIRSAPLIKIHSSRTFSTVTDGTKREGVRAIWVRHIQWTTLSIEMWAKPEEFFRMKWSAVMYLCSSLFVPL